MQQPVAAGHKFNKCTKVENRTHSAVVDFSFLRLSHDGLDFSKGGFNAFLIFRSDLDAADSKGLIFINGDGCAGLLLNTLNNLALGTYHRTYHLLRNLDCHETRNMRLIVFTSLGDGVVYYPENVHASVASLIEGFLKHFITQTIALDVHLGCCDTFIRARDLKVHIAEMILVTENVGQDGIFHVAGIRNKPHCHTGHRTLHLHAGIEQGKRAAAYRGH